MHSVEATVTLTTICFGGTRYERHTKADNGTVPDNERFLRAIAQELPRLDWLRCARSQTAKALGTDASKITRAFKKRGQDTLEDELLHYLLDTDSSEYAWTSTLRNGAVEDVEEAPNFFEGLRTALRRNWRLALQDDRFIAQMLVWSHASTNGALRRRMKRHYREFDDVHRVIRLDMMKLGSAALGRTITQRPGLNEEQMVVLMDGLSDGLSLRARIDPDAVTDDMYSIGAMAILVAAVDWQGDDLSILEALAQVIANGRANTTEPASPDSADHKV